MNGVGPLVSLALAGFVISAPASAPAPEPATAEALGNGWADGPIVAFGDSYTQGWGADPDEAFPTLLALALGVPVHNMGIGGETAAEALPRIQSDVLAFHPRLVVVEFGTNEVFRGQPVATCIVALDEMLSILRAAQVPVVLVGVHFGDYQGNLDAELTRLAERHGTGLVLDALRGVLDDPALTSDGGYHPNGPGYAILETRIRPEVSRMLATP
ncbi:MAG: GDSL-type esterase/lipase family protein [Candidatus Thermoplasmatota archaeon]